MNVAIAEIIKGLVVNLPFVERIAGLVKVATKVETTDAGTVKKLFPVACNVTNADCMSGKYKPLVPDSNTKSVLYFEDFGSQSLGVEKGYWHFRSTVRLVCWLNLQKLGVNNCEFSSMAATKIIATLPIGYMNYGNIIKARIVAISEPEKSSAIFSRYTYNEEQLQYLLYPYDYFALNITLEYQVRDCLDLGIASPINCPNDK